MTQNVKAALRKEMLGLRQALSEAESHCQADAITAHILAWPAYRQAQSIMLYASMPGEVSTRALCRAVLADGKTLLLPRCESRSHMTARRVQSMNRLVPGRMGIAEPAPDTPVHPPSDIDLVLCPGLAFDTWGWRLGFGAGYYDAFLTNTQAIRAGICYLVQRIARVPHAPHDIPMDFLITSQGITARQIEEAHAL